MVFGTIIVHYTASDNYSAIAGPRSVFFVVYYVFQVLEDSTIFAAPFNNNNRTREMSSDKYDIKTVALGCLLATIRRAAGGLPHLNTLRNVRSVGLHVNALPYDST